MREQVRLVLVLLDKVTKWCESFFKPVAKRSNAKPKQNRITFDTQVETVKKTPFYNSKKYKTLYFKVSQKGLYGTLTGGSFC